MSQSVAGFERRRLSLAEYRRLVESGALEDAHVELIDGVPCDMSPRTREHENVIEYLNRVLVMALDYERYRMRPAGSLSLGDSEPDFAIVQRGTAEPYHPASARLVIEVCVSSRKRDLGVKPPIYASAGVEQ